MLTARIVGILYLVEYFSGSQCQPLLPSSDQFAIHISSALFALIDALPRRPNNILPSNPNTKSYNNIFPSSSNTSLYSGSLASKKYSFPGASKSNHLLINVS
jgi:hypothetical protein